MNAIQRHLAAYAEAYLVCLLFVLLQVALSFVAQAQALTPAARKAMDPFAWLVFKAYVAIGCIPTIIAFLNTSVAKGRAAAAQFLPPVKTSPAPNPAPAPVSPAQPQS